MSYRVAELVWNSAENDWDYAGYYERRYYLTRFFAVRRALKLQMQHPNHKYVVEHPRSDSNA
jgi:hypothetical protein